ncbi:MAG TPA: hypothetical protein VGW33_03385 [Terriglobia bacterium]|nr:hypothetical protein [Terriglobia bacterium]
MNSTAHAAAGDPARQLLRHTVAILAYRGGKALRGAPVRGENYSRAAIAAGRVGPEQAPPGFEFD